MNMLENYIPSETSPDQSVDIFDGSHNGEDLVIDDTIPKLGNPVLPSHIPNGESHAREQLNRDESKRKKSLKHSIRKQDEKSRTGMNMLKNDIPSETSPDQSVDIFDGSHNGEDLVIDDTIPKLGNPVLHTHIPNGESHAREQLNQSESFLNVTGRCKKTHLCEICNKTFVKRSLLRRHSRIHTRDPFMCKVCKKSFGQKQNFAKHMCVQTGEKAFECETCNRGFTKHSNLQIHRRIHTGEKPYECEVCEQTFAHLGTLTTHMRTHTGEKPFVCAICNKSFTTTSHLRRHALYHTGEKPYRCELCPKAFRQNSNLMAHMHTHTDDKPYVCEVCNKGYTTRSSFLRHVLVHKGGDEVTFVSGFGVCALGQHSTLPGETNMGNKMLKNGIYEEMSNKNVMNDSNLRTLMGEKPYQCEVCEKSFAYAVNLMTHMRIHTGEKPFACQICNARLVTASRLHKHLLNHAAKKTHQCEICNKTFQQFGNLTEHMRSHTGDKPFVCETCNRSYSTRSGFLRHRISKAHLRKNKLLDIASGAEVCASNRSSSPGEIDLGEERFESDISGGTYPPNQIISHPDGNSSNIKTRHLQSQISDVETSSDKPYRCELCNKSFSQKGYLVIHGRIHAGVKPFVCQMCNKGFTNSSHLRRHERTHLEKKPYVCQVCKRTFSRISTLTQHTYVHKLC